MLYQLIEISGSDAEEFLQGQLTQDVSKLDASISLLAAWCNAKGRVITMIRLLALGNSIGLVVPAALIETIVPKLTMYRLRADVSIERAKENWLCIAISNTDELARLDSAGLLPRENAACSKQGLIVVDYSGGGRFVEIFGSADAFASAKLTIENAMSDEEHALMKMRAGLAEILPANTEKYTPHMLNLDWLGAISFDKGCYTGQEVVARTQNLGESKRRLKRYRCDAPDIAIGDKLSDGGRDVGTVVNVQGTELLAVTPVALHEQQLIINGSAATPLD